MYPQREKLKAVVVMCGIVYVLNILRLVVFYPIAVNSCLETPNVQACLTPMWQFHETVYTWGFLVVLVSMWLVWFLRFGVLLEPLQRPKKTPPLGGFQGEECVGNEAQGTSRCGVVAVRVGHDQHLNQSRGH